MHGASPVPACLAEQLLACGRAQHEQTSAAKNGDVRLGSGELHFPEKQSRLEKFPSLLSKVLFTPCPSKAREEFSLPSLCAEPLSQQCQQVTWPCPWGHCLQGPLGPCFQGLLPFALEVNHNLWCLPTAAHLAGHWLQPRKVIPTVTASSWINSRLSVSKPA